MGNAARVVDPKGSVVLQRWNEQRRIERALSQRATKWHRGNGFAGAGISRLTASLAQMSLAINADLDSALVVLRSRARSLCANNEFARRFLSLVAGNVVGAFGPTLQVRAKTTAGELDKPANDAVEIHWCRWAKVADLGGRMSLAHLLRVAVKAVARDGEVLVRVVRERKLPYGLALQLLEADRLDESINKTLAGGNRIRMGVELDSAGRAIAYYIKEAHPGEAWGSAPARVERVPARDVYHLFLQERPEQVRGYTWLHAVLMRMNMLHAFEEAAVIAARVGASKMGVFTKKEDAASDLSTVADEKDEQGNLQMSAEPGEFVELPPGYALETWDPEYPHANFESFLKQCLRGVASGLDVATHNLSGDMTDVNYSSARIAELSERDLWIVLQEWLIGQLIAPVYRDWLASALLRADVTFELSGKALPADKLAKFSDAARFQGRRWEWVDPLKEVKAAREKVAGRLASRTEIAAAQGRDFEDIVDELAAEEKAMTAANLAPETASAPLTDQQLADQEK
jgi:lambda family phage portal protein